MKKLLAQVVALLLVALIAAPAASAQAEYARKAPAKVTAVDGKLQSSKLKTPRSKAQSLGQNVGFSKKATAADVRALMHRRAAKFAPGRVAASQEYYGVVTFASYVTHVSDIQMYKFSTSAPVQYEQASMWSLRYGADYGAVMGEDYFYVTDAQLTQEETRIAGGKVYDAATWELVDEVTIAEGDFSCLGTCAAYDPTTDRIYKIGYRADGDGMQLGIFDPATFCSAPVVALPEDSPLYLAMAFGADGTLYVIDSDGNFGTMDKATARFTLIKATGLSSLYLTSGAIDLAGEKPVFYYAYPTESASELYAIDCATGDFSLVYQYANNESVAGMFFKRDLAKPAAPAKPTLNSVDFAGQALTGTVSFTTPDSLYSGQAPAGQKLRYEVEANGNVVCSGSNLDYGHTYKVKVDMAQAGLYTFRVLCYNEAGASPRSNKVTLWLGADAPAAVKNVNASWAAGKMTLTWDEVTTGLHDGTIGNVTYAIYNAADSTLVKEAITECTYTFDLKAPEAHTEFQYYVVATSDGMQSAAGLSNVVVLGEYLAPFTTDINKSTAADWTIIDANRDRKTWELSASDANVVFNKTENTDDWLISVPIVVKPGYLYNVAVSAKGGRDTFAEEFEVKAGAAPTVDAMTVTVIEPTKVTSTLYSEFTGKFIAQSEKVYLGIHGISQPDQLRLYVNRLSIDGGVVGDAPVAPTGLSVLVPYSGENKATLTYAAPTLTVSGAALEGDKALTRVEVLLNGEVKFVDNQPVAGASSSLEIAVPDFGVYDFEVVAYNAAGRGDAAKASVYVGINVPSAPTGLKITEVSDGVVDLAWDQVATDIDGNVMNPALVKYAVGIPSWDEDGQLQLDVLAEGLEANELKSIQAVAKDDQAFVQYAVVASSEAGESVSVSGIVPVGAPYKLPFTETFADGDSHHIFAYSGDKWGAIDDANGFGMVSRNGDNGFIACYSDYLDFFGNIYLTGAGYGELYSGKIAVSEKDTELSFYYGCIGTDNRNTLDTKVICDGDTATVSSVVTSGTGWKRCVVDMKPYAGKTVQIAFRSTVVNGFIDGYHGFIDDIRLGDPIKVDVVAEAISASAVVYTEKDFTIDYTLLNQGTDSAKNVRVSLYANGNLVESCVDTIKLASGQRLTGTFSKAAFSIFEAGDYEFSFVAECEADEDQTNNTSAVAKVSIANHEFPALLISGTAEVSAADSTATVNLAWDTPAIDLTAVTVTESFESDSYPAFTVESFGGWTLRNLNDSYTFIIDGVDYPLAGEPVGWQLFDAEAVGVSNSNIGAYEGDCYMAAPAHQDGANDAWLISPSMNGLAQTVTFYAKSATTDFGPETMECYISSTGTEVADFTQVDIQGGYDDAEGVPSEWTQYSIVLPAGTQHFAIRSTGYWTMLLMIDNIQYYSESPFINLELKGYDVYRNQEKLNKEPLKAEQYTDVVKKEGKYDYSVVAVYNDGNSAPSNVYTVDVAFTGLADAVAGVKVAVEGSEIVVSGAEAVTIASVDGKLVYAGQSARVAVAPGIYVVKADATTAKVIVK